MIGKLTSALLVALTVVLPAPAARAQPRPESLVLAVYLPDTALALPQLTELASSLARQLGAALHAEVVPRAYRREEDFLAALDEGNIDWALCEPLLVATRGLKVIAAATSGDQVVRRFAAYTRRAQPLAELFGKRLASVRTVRHRQLLQNILFEGELDPAQHFTWLATPDVASALEVVRAGRAELAIAPMGSATGLHEEPLGPALPTPALVQASSRHPELLAALRAAVPQVRLAGPFQGLRVSTGKAYLALAADLRGQKKSFALPAPPAPELPFQLLGKAPAGKLELAPIQRLIGLTDPHATK